MAERQDFAVLEVPRAGVNDDVVRLLEWLAREGQGVASEDPIAVLETTKVTFELTASRAGYLFPLVEAGAEVPVGAPVALISDGPERPAYRPEAPATASGEAAGEQLVTEKARALIDEHRVPLTRFAGLPVVRAEDVETVLRGGVGAEQAPRLFRGERLDPQADWDAVCETQLFRELTGLLTALRKRMMAKHQRHVSTGDLLYDRWDLAKDYGFGEGTSVYDTALILGEVTVGRHCWIGPGAILDGQGGLTIGDYVDVGASAQIYTHNTIERALTGQRAPLFKKATTIGSCCFIAPHVMISPGSVLGDHTFVGAGSYVEGSFPANSYISGNPARRVGSVEVRGARARVRPLEHPSPAAHRATRRKGRKDDEHV